MRFTLLTFAAAAAVAALGVGCKPPPPAQIESRFRSEVKLYFDNLNQEAIARKENLRREQALAEANPALRAPTGTIYSTYTFDDAGFVVDNFKCQVCSVKLLLPFPSAEYLCRSCGHSPYKTGHPTANLKKSPCADCIDAKGFPKEPVEAQNRETFKRFEGAAVRDMFEVTDTNKEKGTMNVTVRYVRRVWVYDDKATVQVSTKAVERAVSDPAYIPSGNASEDPTDKLAKYQRAGFHRPDTTYVGEIKFEYRGGVVTQVGAPREEPVRPWKDILGNKD